MKTIVLGGLVLVATVGCPGPHPGTTTGTSGSTTSGSSGGNTTGSSGSGTSGSGTTTGGTSSGGTSTGGGPGAPCGDGLAWYGDVCAAPDCNKVGLYTTCALTTDGGGFGECTGQACSALDTQYDQSNCGIIGIRCPIGFYCNSGWCTPFSGPSRFVDCNVDKCSFGSCLQYRGCIPSACDYIFDAQACELDAGAGPASAYPPLGICCGTSCLDSDNDRNNCGNCGVACAANEVCVDSACVAAQTCGPTNNNDACALPSGAAGACCLGKCVDLTNDSANCGSCGWGCTVDAGCANSSCAYGTVCPAGTGMNEHNLCSPESCGPDSLGTPCAPDGGASFYSCCSSGCIDTQFDQQNCGKCGVACGSGTQCISGSCQVVMVCTDSRGSCALDGGVRTGSCCEGLCVDTPTDSKNCGGCGIACPPGTFCFNNCTADYIHQAVCDAGGCPAGTTCTAGQCLSSICGALSDTIPCARDAGAFAVAGVCCSGACVDLSSDLQNCGFCGAVCLDGGSCTSFGCQYDGGGCPPGTGCTFSTSPCTSCLPLGCEGQGPESSCAFGTSAFYVTTTGTCCAHVCTDILHDPANCGGCGVTCPSGLCTDGACFDPDPPGGCLQTCAPYTRCVRGSCVDSTCTGAQQGQACLAEDGTVGVCCFQFACGHLLDDPQNCGACFITCPPGQTCANGTCSGSPDCGPAHMGGFCDLDAGTNFLCCPGYGCVDTSSDPSNCGGCLYPCQSGMSCTNGICH